MAFDIKYEILPIKKHKEFGIEILKGKEKLTLNTNKKELYIDLCSLAWAMGISMNQLLV